MNYTKHLITVGALFLLSAMAFLPWKTLFHPDAQHAKGASPFEREMAKTEAWLASLDVSQSSDITAETFEFGKWEPVTNLDPSAFTISDDLPLPEKGPGDLAWMENGILKLMPSAPSSIVICTDEGTISVNLRTGAVEIVEGTKLPKVALAFWKAVAKAFPEARQIIIGENHFGGPTDQSSLRFSGN